MPMAQMIKIGDNELAFSTLNSPRSNRTVTISGANIESPTAAGNVSIIDNEIPLR